MKYSVKGMSCAVCQKTVEQCALSTQGVLEANVNLLTNSMDVNGDYDEKELINAVKAAGYGIKPIKDKDVTIENDITNKQTIRELLIRFLLSIVLLVPLMIVAMGHKMIGMHNGYVIATIELVLTLIIIVINYKYFYKGLAALIRFTPNMDSLVSIGAGSAFVYSLYIYIKMIINNNIHVHDLYFESTATILTLITFGKTLEAYSKGKTNDAIKGFMEMSPKTAIILKDGNEIEVDVKTISVGDIFILKPGASVPVDGIVLDGTSSIDESMLTGESIPVDKETGSDVYTATINTNGYLKCKATKVGEDTTLSRIIELVSEASSSKAPIARIADKVAGVFVPAVMLIAIITFVIWMILDYKFSFALTRAISVLVISCPCALGLATPVAILVGNGVSARLGILFKNAAALEMAGKTKVVCLDKTGTITKGNMKVEEIVNLSDVDIDKALSILASMEAKSEHPLAKAIVAYHDKTDLNISGFETVTGSGIKAVFENVTYYVGNADYIKNCGIDINSDLNELYSKGMTVIILANSNKALIGVGIVDEIKSDSKNAIANLKKLGVKPVMLTGDNEMSAKAIADYCGISEYHSGIKPDQKEKIVNDYSNLSYTAMVGDGINDAPSLIRAHTGIAIGSGADIAVESADVVILNDNLSSVPKAIKISQSVIRNIHENLFWAFIYNVIFIPVAAGVLYPGFKIALTPMMGSLAMGLSSVCVVMNALRLNFLRKKLGGKNE